MLKYSYFLSAVFLCSVLTSLSAPVNDSRDAAFGIFETGYVVGNNAEASAELNEASHGGLGVGKSLWWNWEANFGTHTLTLRPYRENVAVVLTVYASDGEGLLSEVASVEAAGGEPRSIVVDFVSGVDYQIVVDSPKVGSAGWFYFSINQAPEIFAPVVLTLKEREAFEVPIQISGFPEDVRVEMEGFALLPTPEGYSLFGSLGENRDGDTIELFASNEYGETWHRLTLIKQNTLPQITSSAGQLGFVGVPFEYALELDGGDSSGFELLNAILPRGFFLSNEAGGLKLKGLPMEAGENKAILTLRPDSGGSILSAVVTLQIVDPGDAQIVPELTSPLSIQVAPGAAFTYKVTSSVPVSRFTAHGLPPGVTINETTGVISGVIDSLFHSEIWSLQAEYPGGVVEGRLSVYPRDEHTPVQFQVPPVLIAHKGVPFAYQIKGDYPLFDFFADGSLPPWLSLEYETGWIRGTPTQSGSYDFQIEARNEGWTESEMVLTIKVLDDESSFRLTGASQFVLQEGKFISISLTGVPAPTEENGVDANSLPGGLSFDRMTQSIIGVPRHFGFESAEFFYGEHRFSLGFWTVPTAHGPKFLNAAMARGVVGEFFYFPLNAPGADYFEILGGLPQGLSFDSGTGVISGMPSRADSTQVLVRARDGSRSSEALLEFVITETVGESAPLILSPGQMVGSVGEPIVYSIGSNQASGAYSAIDLPPGLTIDTFYGIIFGVPESPTWRPIRVEHGDAVAEIELRVLSRLPSPLLITSSPSALGKRGAWFEYQIELNREAEWDGYFHFQPGSGFPSGWTLNHDTGLISGYLGDDWPPQIEYSVDSPDGFAEGVLTIVAEPRETDLLPTNSGHVVAYVEDFVDYDFELADPRFTVEINSNRTGLIFDPQAQRLYGYLSEQGTDQVNFEITDPENPSVRVTGVLTFQVGDRQDRPLTRVISPMAPTLTPGKYFEYIFEFDRPGGADLFLNIQEDWLVQDGDRIAGYVPEDWSSNKLFVDGQIEHYQGDLDFELVVNTSEPELPTVLTSAASVYIETGETLDYTLEFENLDEADTINVNAPAWIAYDEASRRLTGVSDSFGVASVVIEVIRGGFNPTYTVRVFSSPQPRRVPEVVAWTPPPLFPGLDWEMPLRGVLDSRELLFSASELEYRSVSGRLFIPAQDWNGGFDHLIELMNTPGGFSFFIEAREVEAAPFVTEDPISMTTPLDGRAYFTAQWIGGGHQQQWLKDDGTLISSMDTLGFEDVVLGDQGSYRLHLTNLVGEAYTNPALLTIGKPKRLRDWTLSQVGELYDWQPGGLPEESWMGDGMANLMKWATGLSLTETSTGAITEGELVDGAMEFRFDRNVDAEDVSLTVERSGSLAVGSWERIAWRPAGGSWLSTQGEVTVSESGEGDQRMVLVRDTDMDPGQSFYRMRADIISE